MIGARELLAQALDRPVTDLPPDPNVGNTDGWDSLAHARLILRLEEELSRELTTEEIATIGGLSDIEAIMAGAGG